LTNPAASRREPVQPRSGQKCLIFHGFLIEPRHFTQEKLMPMDYHTRAVRAKDIL
jgi:hypothetical protein